MTEEYEDGDCSVDFPEKICCDIVDSNDDPDQCILCGNVGKLFKISEARGLSSKISKYLPFMKVDEIRCNFKIRRFELNKILFIVVPFHSCRQIIQILYAIDAYQP